MQLRESACFLCLQGQKVGSVAWEVGAAVSGDRSMVPDAWLVVSEAMAVVSPSIGLAVGWLEGMGLDGAVL